LPNKKEVAEYYHRLSTALDCDPIEGAAGQLKKARRLVSTSRHNAELGVVLGCGSDKKKQLETARRLVTSSGTDSNAQISAALKRRQRGLQIRFAPDKIVNRFKDANELATEVAKYVNDATFTKVGGASTTGH